MTEEEALEDVTRIIAGTVLKTDTLAKSHHSAFLLGKENAQTLIRALNSAGWDWVRRDV